MTKRRFPVDTLGYYVYMGKSPLKKIKNVVFYPGKPSQVWDRKIHTLIQRLPYMREATEEEIAALQGAVKPIRQAQKADEAGNADRDALRAELDRRKVKYDMRWGAKRLMEELQKAPMIVEEPANESEPAAEDAA